MLDDAPRVVGMTGVNMTIGARAPDLSTVPSTVLVVGGTGMLGPAVRELLDSARTVVLVARRASNFHHKDDAGRLVTVDADWEDAEQFGETLRRAVHGLNVEAALLWVHLPHRDPVVRVLDDLLPPGAVVVRLWGTGSGQPREDAHVAARLEGRTMREVYLGSVASPQGWRWLTHSEISAGALEALAGADTHHIVGKLGSR